MKLDVESLRALRAVVASGTFTEAAMELGMTQSAVSWKIKRLEERVGLELVKRGSEVEATPDGEDLLLYAARIIEAHDEAVERLQRSDLSGTIRLGTNEDLRGGKLADVLARFSRMYPHVHLDVRVHLSGIVREWLDDGEVDVAVVQIPTDDIRPDDVVLWTEPVEWVHSDTIDFELTDVLPIVSFGPGLVYLEDSTEALARRGLRARSVLECPMLSGVQAGVDAGLGICALNPRNRTSSMVTWKHSAEAPLPSIAEVIRTSTDGDPELLRTLREELSDALVDSRSSATGIDGQDPG